jgi:hypothetical protein
LAYQQTFTATISLATMLTDDVIVPAAAEKEFPPLTIQLITSLNWNAANWCKYSSVSTDANTVVP